MSTNKAGKLQQIANMLGKADDIVQRGVRDHILRLPNDGSRLPDDARMGGLRDYLGKSMHQHRSADADTYYKRGQAPSNFGGVIASRAGQAAGLAGVTAAGVALMNTGDQITKASKPQKGPLYDFTETDRMVMEDVRQALTDGSLSEIELHEAAKNGAFTKPQLLLISDIHDWSRLGQEHYPFGDMTIMEAVSP